MTINLTTGANTIKIAPERYDGTEYTLKCVNLQTNKEYTANCIGTLSGQYINILLTVVNNTTTTDNEIQLTEKGEYIYTLTGITNNIVCKVGRLIYDIDAREPIFYTPENNTKIVYNG